MGLLRQLTYITALCCVLSACNKVRPAVSERPVEAQSPSPKSCSTADLRQQLDEIASATNGPVGVAVTLIEEGEVVALKGTQRFPMQSVYKLPIGMAVLRRVDEGTLKLDQKIVVKPSEFVGMGQHSPIRDKNPRGVELTLGELLRYAVSESDGTASDVLLRTAGGGAAVTEYLKDLGVDGIRVLNTEKEIGRSVDVQYRNWATPESALALLRIVSESKSFSPGSQELLLKLMTETPTGMNRIKGMLPPGTLVAHKTGSSETIGGITRATNDIGLVTLPDGKHLGVAVFVSDTKLDTAAREAVIAKIARAAWDCWVNPGR